MSEKNFCLNGFIEELEQYVYDECEDLTDEDAIRKYIDSNISRICIYTSDCYAILNDLVVCDWSDLVDEFGEITTISDLTYYALKNIVSQKINIQEIVKEAQEKQERLEEIDNRLDEIDECLSDILYRIDGIDDEIKNLNCQINNIREAAEGDLTDEDQNDIDVISEKIERLLEEKDELANEIAEIIDEKESY